MTSPTALSTNQAASLLAARPHLKYVSGEHRGYVVLDITRERLQADWWYVPTVLERTASEQFGRGMISPAARPHLVEAATPASPIEFE